MAIYAIPETAHVLEPVNGSPYLTPGKRYRAKRQDHKVFAIFDDNGHTRACLWEGCAHGGNWTRVEVDDEDDSVIVSRAAAPADENVEKPSASDFSRLARTVMSSSAAPRADMWQSDEPADTTGLDLTGSETLKLVPAGNGGWVVYRVEAPHLHDTMIGAYSSAEEMCAALTEALA